MSKQACIIGAGPAGLTAALELIKRTDIKPVILEMSNDIGGLSKTINYHGNRIDIGGHRFFSKSEQVMKFWQEILPQESPKCSACNQDEIMLLRNRLSRIFFLRKFYNYPLALNSQTLSNLGLKKTLKIGFGYMHTQISPVQPEKTLEDFFINRFGHELYQTFFKDYTEKVWGVSCKDIPRDWGTQRVKGLSVGKVLQHAVTRMLSFDKSLGQKKTETSLIERFLYPKYGPGQLWEKAASMIQQSGGEILTNHKVIGVKCAGKKINSVVVFQEKTGSMVEITADYFFSSMPVRELIEAFAVEGTVPANVQSISRNLVYRDFVTIGVLLRSKQVRDLPDNWIYIQERDVKVGRIQVFNNWSPYMVKNKDTVWLGLEYFANEGDSFWNKSDNDLKLMAVEELRKLNFINGTDVLDVMVLRVPKAYPAYFGSYNNFDSIREYVDGYTNLFLVGRNGMHRYNNMDHSMLTAITAVDNVIKNRTDKSNIWAVNTEEEYHEEDKINECS